MIRLSRFTVAAILLVPAAAIAQSAAVGILAAQSDNASLSATATEVRARVVELDRPARVLTLLGPDGSLHSIHVPASVKNLAQVGLGDELVSMVRPISRERPLRASPQDADYIRAAACAADEAMTVADTLEASQALAAYASLCQRYSRFLDVTPMRLAEAVESAKQQVGSDGALHFF